MDLMTYAMCKAAGGSGGLFIINISGQWESPTADKTVEEISAALNEGKLPVALWENGAKGIYYLTYVDEDVIFACTVDDGGSPYIYFLTVDSDSNWTTNDVKLAVAES